MVLESRIVLLAYVFAVELQEINAFIKKVEQGNTAFLRPNVIFFLVDDMGYGIHIELILLLLNVYIDFAVSWMDSSVYGSLFYETPHIDALAAEGMLFRRAYSASPFCSPTRASILTGKYPARLRITNPDGHLVDTADSITGAEFARDSSNILLKTPLSRRHLHRSEYSLAHAFRDNGYSTAHIGKWHLGREPEYWPDRFGYDYVMHSPGPTTPSYFAPYGFREGNFSSTTSGKYMTDHITEEAIRYMDVCIERKQRFYIAVWHYAVHGPLQAKDNYVQYFSRKAQHLNTTYNITQFGNGIPFNVKFAAMLKSVDDSVGSLVRHLKTKRVFRDTIIIFTSDNGGLLPDTSNYPLRGGKGSCYQGGDRVPLIITWPRRIAANLTTDELTSSIDFFPTLVGVLNLTVSNKVLSNIDGRDISEIWFNSSTKSSIENVIYDFWPHGFIFRPPCVSVTHKVFKLIKYFGDDNVFPSVLELYNLQNDIGESKNIASEHPVVTSTLIKEIEYFLRRTNASVPVRNQGFNITAAICQVKLKYQSFADRSCLSDIIWNQSFILGHFLYGQNVSCA
jgi:arylsulfatase A-like enzyme